MLLDLLPDPTEMIPSVLILTTIPSLSNAKINLKTKLESVLACSIVNV